MANQQDAVVQEETLAPHVRLETDTGETFDLSSLRGKNVVLYFYPRANTPGCTVEACEFRDAAKSFAAMDAVVVGVSPDPVVSQSNFKSKFHLPFTLLCDTQKTVAKAYGVLKEKNMYGRRVIGIERTTFLIGKDGRIKKIFRKVKPKGHAAEVLQVLSRL